METPETGMFGPGDYPADFVTIDARKESWMETMHIAEEFEFYERSAVVTALIELAHDLDARGLVLVPEVATPDMRMRGAIEMNAHKIHGSKFKAGSPDIWASMVKEGVTEFPPLPPEPSSTNTGSL